MEACAKSMIQVVVNADDYGHDENRTRAIQEAFRLGAITATTAMANRPWFERAMGEARDLGFLSDVGLHFNITEGIPLTEEMSSCSLLCDESGAFAPRFHQKLAGRLLLPQRARKAIRHEAEAQIQKYLDCGGCLMHLDSHHHVHTDFSVTAELYDVAVRYGFKSSRLARNLVSREGLLRRAYKGIWNRYAQNRLPSRVKWFGCYSDFEGNWDKIGGNENVEVMIHPLYLKDGELHLDGVLCDTKLPISDEIAFWHKMSSMGIFMRRYSELVE